MRRTEDHDLGRCVLALIGYLLAAMLLGCPTNIAESDTENTP